MPLRRTGGHNPNQGPRNPNRRRTSNQPPQIEEWKTNPVEARRRLEEVTRLTFDQMQQEHADFVGQAQEHARRNARWGTQFNDLVRRAGQQLELYQAKLKHLAEPVARPAGGFDAAPVHAWRDLQSAELERLRVEIPSKGARDACVILEQRIKDAIARNELDKEKGLRLIVHIFAMARKVPIEASAPAGDPPTPAGPNYPREVKMNRATFMNGVTSLFDNDPFNHIPREVKLRILLRKPEVVQAANGELKLRNIDLSPETIKRKLEQDPAAIAKLKTLLREGAERGAAGKELLQRSIEQVIRECYAGVLSPEQQRIFEIQAPALALQVANDLVGAMQQALDFEAKQETGFFQRLYSRMTKRLTTSIALTIVAGVGVAFLAPVVFPALAGASLWATASVGGLAGVTRALVGIGSKLFSRHKAKKEGVSVEDLDKGELYAKEKKMIDDARVKILNEGVKQTDGTRKEFLTVDLVSNIATNGIRVRTTEDFVALNVAEDGQEARIERCVVDPETGKLRGDALSVLYKNIRDFFDHDPRYKDLTREQKKKEAKLLFALYARKLTQREELINLMDKQVKDPGMIKLLKASQKLMGGNIDQLLGVKDSDETGLGAFLHVTAAGAMGAGMKVAYQNRYVAGGVLALGGAILGYNYGKQREEADILKEYHKRVDILVGRGERTIKDIVVRQDVMTSDIEANLERDVQKLRVLLSLNKAEGIPLIQDPILRQRAEGMIHQFEKLKQEKHRKQFLHPEVEAGKKAGELEHNFSGRMRRIAKKMSVDQQALAKEVGEHVHDVAEKRRREKKLYTVLGGLAGFAVGFWGRDASAAIAKQLGIGGDQAPHSGNNIPPLENPPENGGAGHALGQNQPGSSAGVGSNFGTPNPNLNIPPGGGAHHGGAWGFPEAAIVNKGEGVEKVLIDQIKLDPNKFAQFGLPANASGDQVGQFAHLVAIDQGYMPKGAYNDCWDFAKMELPGETDVFKINERALEIAASKGLKPQDFFDTEVRVRPIDQTAYWLHKDASGKLVVTEHDATGAREIGDPRTVDQHEYEETFGKGLGRKPEPGPKSFHEEVENQWGVAKDNPNTAVDETDVRRQTMISAQAEMLMKDGHASYNTPDGVKEYQSWLAEHYPNDAKNLGSDILIHQFENKDEEVLKILNYPEGRKLLAEAFVNKLDRELHEGFLFLGGADNKDLAHHLMGFGKLNGLSADETHLFIEYLKQGKDELKKGMFKPLTEDGHLSFGKLSDAMDRFQDRLINADDLPEIEDWVPRTIQYAYGDPINALVKKVGDNQYWIKYANGAEDVQDAKGFTELLNNYHNQ